MSAAGLLNGRYPAIVKSYDQNKRTCRIEIPGLTDGCDVFPEAEIEYPIGDKARHASWGTEIEILSGDTVWIAFIGGDPRYPIITGYRNPRVSNSIDWRRIHHKNIEQIADQTMHLESGVLIKTDAGETIQVNAGSTIEVSAGTSIKFSVGGSVIEMTGASVTISSAQINLNGPISGGGSGGATASFTGEIVSKKDVQASGISLVNHTHTGDSGGTTSKPM